MTHRMPTLLRLTLRGALLLAVAGLAACSQEKPETTLTTILIPNQWTVVAHNSSDVYDFVSGMAADAGLTLDPGNSFKVNGTLTSKRVLCSPNGQERHTAWCVFKMTVSPAPDFNAPPPPQVMLRVKIDVPERVAYDKDKALQQVRIEPVLDAFANKLAVRFGAAQVSGNGQLTF